ncbi:MAG: tetratricopeptide repeat protein, partial [Planctomycetota bacterium]
VLAGVTDPESGRPLTEMGQVLEVWDIENAAKLRRLAGAATRRVTRVAAMLLLVLLPLVTACKARSLEQIRGEQPVPMAPAGGGAPKANPKEAATLAKARSRVERGDYDSALALFQEVLRDNPKLPDAWVGVGDVHTGLQQWEQAESAYANAVGLDNDNFEAHFGRGKALQVLNRLLDAIRSYHRALLIRPDDFDANLNMATAYLQLDQADTAITYA